MERLMRAECSDDLSEAKDGGTADVDWLRAAGAVARRHSLALAIWRMAVRGEGRHLRDVVRGLEALAESNGVENAGFAVVAVAGHLAEPGCRECCGRGFAVVPDTPMLSASECSACRGSGVRPLPAGAGVKDLHARVQGLQAFAAGEISKKLRH